MTITWTFRERTVKCCTVGQAISVAQQRVPDTQLCLDVIYNRGHRRPNNEPITLVELNEIADRIVADSYYYAT